jgi:zinc transporter 1/2/3
MFANDCVGHLVYEATAPALALAAALLTFLLDFVGSRVAHAKLDRNGAHRPHSPASPETPPSDDDQSRDKDQVAAEPVIGTEVCAHAEAVFRSEQGWQVILLEAGIIFHS